MKMRCSKVCAMREISFLEVLEISSPAPTCAGVIEDLRGQSEKAVHFGSVLLHRNYLHPCPRGLKMRYDGRAVIDMKALDRLEGRLLAEGRHHELVEGKHCGIVWERD